eukprot:scaffold241986_cov35-Tisochrysis_lutea.AAC.4
MGASASVSLVTGAEIEITDCRMSMMIDERDGRRVRRACEGRSLLCASYGVWGVPGIMYFSGQAQALLLSIPIPAEPAAMSAISYE